ncbi:MAG: ATP-dependent DNA ligase [Nitrospirae bacterium RBG_19FT_COMBO_42_15]|nr:MAG: ATP-dependent DNA ligase [Nitrospirae bacterium RBG_19FT_COMBO_42_15]
MTESLSFVVHKHYATHLHYDLRLEMDGILKSWAVPKEPPIKTGTKRLAIAVEDHELSYKDFEGIIPEGNYGAGRVEIWDNGKYILHTREKDKIVVDLNGERLKGKYALIHTKGDQWLFFKTTEQTK